MAKARAKAAKLLPADTRPVCGLIMPISAIDGCSEHHWREVSNILKEAAALADFRAQLVSDAVDTGVIHRRIVNNLYSCPVAVCDMSARNPNVMFEFGMRVAFGKPTVLIKDDKTPYSFDTSVIEHIEYPRDLRHYSVIAFRDQLAEKIRATARETEQSFLKSFGSFSVASLPTQEVSPERLEVIRMREELDDLKRLVKVGSRPGSVHMSSSSLTEMEVVHFLMQLKANRPELFGGANVDSRYISRLVQDHADTLGMTLDQKLLQSVLGQLSRG